MLLGTTPPLRLPRRLPLREPLLEKRAETDRALRYKYLHHLHPRWQHVLPQHVRPRQQCHQLLRQLPRRLLLHLPLRHCRLRQPARGKLPLSLRSNPPGTTVCPHNPEIQAGNCTLRTWTSSCLPPFKYPCVPLLACSLVTGLIATSRSARREVMGQPWRCTRSL